MRKPIIAGNWKMNKTPEEAATLVTDLTMGSSLDRSGQIGIDLWKHHFGQVTTAAEVVAGLQANQSSSIESRQA